MDQGLTFNERLEIAGVKTIRLEAGKVLLEFKGKIIERPFVKDIEKVCVKEFGIKI